MKPDKSLIPVANEQVSITAVCGWIGMSVPEDIPEGKSAKVNCPFGEIWHSDQGVAAAFRIYPSSNSAYCFACVQYYSPVSLAAAAWDKPPVEVAKDLLERIGHKVKTTDERWDEIQSWERSGPDVERLASALRSDCARMDPDWETSQFSPRVSDMFDKCLSLLSKVNSDAAAELWQRECQGMMKTVIEIDRTWRKA